MKKNGDNSCFFSSFLIQYWDVLLSNATDYTRFCVANGAETPIPQHFE